MENVRHLPPPTDGMDGIDRQPPADMAAEQAVLKECMHGGAAAYTAAAAVLYSRADFYKHAHQIIWDLLGQQVRDGKPTDPIALRAELLTIGLLREAGGANYLFEIAGTFATGGAEYYAQIIRERAELRAQDDLALRIKTEIGRGTDPSDIARLIEDHQQAAQTRAAASTGAGPTALMGALLDWDTLFETDFGNVQLLPGRLMAPGQQAALVGDGKAGKSLLALEWAWRMATGRPFLGSPAQDPIPVLYIDAENGHEQIQSRLISYGATPEGMGLLRYASFPPVRPLDTAQGGADLIALARATGAQVVFIDTVSRFISGVENDADTWLALYRHTLLPLKAAGIASVRLDHFGKDKERGGRGSSAKTQDVDHVWELEARGDGILTLTRTHTRTGVGEDSFMLLRQARKRGDHWEAGGTRHVLVTEEHRASLIPGSPENIAAQLDRAGVPSNFGREKLRSECARLGIAVRTDTLTQVAALRKKRAGSGRGQVVGQVGVRSDQRFSPGVRSGSGQFVQNPMPDPPQDHDETGQDGATYLTQNLTHDEYMTPDPGCGSGTHKTPGQTRPNPPGVSLGQVTTGPDPLTPLLEGGQVGRATPTHTTPDCTRCHKPLADYWAALGHDQHVLCDPDD